MLPSSPDGQRAPVPVAGVGARDPYEDVSARREFSRGVIHKHKRPDGMFAVASANHGFCNRCGEAFGSIRAFDMHMESATSRRCIRPHESEPRDGYRLTAVPNRYGTPVWRRVR